MTAMVDSMLDGDIARLAAADLRLLDEPDEEFLVDYLADLGWAGRSRSRSATPQIPRQRLVTPDKRIVRFAYAHLALQAARFDVDYRQINRILGLIDEDAPIGHTGKDRR